MEQQYTDEQAISVNSVVNERPEEEFRYTGRQAGRQVRKRANLIQRTPGGSKCRGSEKNIIVSSFFTGN